MAGPPSQGGLTDGRSADDSSELRKRVSDLAGKHRKTNFALVPWQV